MKYKLLTLLLLTALFSLSVVSAADLISVSKGPVLTKTNYDTYFELTKLSPNDIIKVSGIPTTLKIDDGVQDSGRFITLSLSNPGVWDDSNKIKVDATISSISEDFKYNLKTYDFPEITITATNYTSYYDKLSEFSGQSVDDLLALDDLSVVINTLTSDQKDELTTLESGLETEEETVTFQFLNTFCENGDVKDGVRELEIVSVKDKSSKDDWEWKPLDKVNVEVKVRYNNPDDDEDEIDAILEVKLYDTLNNEFVDLDNDDSDLELDLSLEEGKKDTETITLEIPVDEVEDSSSRYKLYVKVYEDGEEDKLCSDKIDGDSYFKDIKIDKKSYDVILSKLDISSPAPCDEEIEVSARVYNIGTHDEDQVYVTLYNKELKLKLNSEVFSLDEGDSKQVKFNFVVPKGTEEKSYVLKMFTSFNYKESSDTYRDESDEYSVNLDLEGNCKIEKKDVKITAELDQETPEAIAGKQVIIKTTLENTGDVKTSYSVSVYGNSGWSSVAAIDPKTIVLEPGESKDVSIYLDLDKDAEGEKEFTIKSVFDNQSNDQKVSLTIVKGVGQDYLVEHLRNNWFIYAIVIVNLILIIAIISVIKRMSSRPSAVM